MAAAEATATGTADADAADADANAADASVASLSRRLAAAAAAAVEAAAGAELAAAFVEALPALVVKRTNNPSAGFDYRSDVAKRAGHFLRRRAPELPVLVADLASAVVRLATDDGGDGPPLLCDARPNPREKGSGAGEVLLLTWRHSVELRAAGLLPCCECGAWFKGALGYRCHLQTKHEWTDFVRIRGEVDAELERSEEAVAGDGVHAGGGGGGRGRRAESLPPACAAARDGDLGALQAMVAEAGGADEVVARARDRFGVAALSYAAGGGHTEVVRWLLREAGADAADQGASGGATPRGYDRSALHWACRNGSVDVAALLIQEGGVDVDIRTSDATTPFHLAVWQGHLPLCRILVERWGADLHAVNDHGCNAIFWAASRGDVCMCKWLKGAGLDCALANANGVGLGMQGTRQPMTTDDRPPTTSQRLTDDQRQPSSIAHHPPPFLNPQPPHIIPYQHNALHKSAYRGHRTVGEFLLDRGGCGLTELKAKDPDGMRPCDVAAMAGHNELATWLGSERERREGTEPEGA